MTKNTIVCLSISGLVGRFLTLFLLKTQSLYFLFFGDCISFFLGYFSGGVFPSTGWRHVDVCVWHGLTTMRFTNTSAFQFKKPYLNAKSRKTDRSDLIHILQFFSL